MVFKIWEKDSNSSKSTSSFDKVATASKDAVGAYHVATSGASLTGMASGFKSLVERRHSMNENVVACKPFFIMDWLEDVNQVDLEQAQRMLKTPPKEELSHSQRSRSDYVAPIKHFDSESSLPSREGLNQRASSGSSFFRKKSISIGMGWNAKGLAKAKKGLWEDALACWENALAIREQVLGNDHIDVANTYNNMGIAYGKLEQSSQAISFLQMALKIRVKEHGDKHAQVAATLHNLGNVLQHSGDLDSAIEYFSRAKDVQENMFTHQHVQVARACVAMGHAYFQGKHYEKSHEAFCEALVIFERLKNGEDLAVEVEATRNEIQELEELMYPSGH